jgi:hypothetical protein
MSYTDWNKIWESHRQQSDVIRCLYLFAEYTNAKIPGSMPAPRFFKSENPGNDLLQLSRYLFANRIYQAIEPYIDGSIHPMSPMFSSEEILRRIKIKIKGSSVPKDSELDALFTTIKQKTGVDIYSLSVEQQQSESELELTP